MNGKVLRRFKMDQMERRDYRRLRGPRKPTSGKGRLDDMWRDGRHRGRERVPATSRPRATRFAPFASSDTERAMARHGNGLRPSRKQPCLQTSHTSPNLFSVQAQRAVFVSPRSGVPVSFVGGGDAGHRWVMDVACRACMAMRRRYATTKVSVFRAERRSTAQQPASIILIDQNNTFLKQNKGFCRSGPF